MIVAGCEFPAELFYLVEHQVWLRLHGDGTGTVGITAMGIVQAGEIYMCRPKLVGTVVQQGKSLAVVELAKSIVSVKSPVCGEVLEVNALLAAQPDRVHGDPYGSGWLARLRLTAWDADSALLVHGAGVEAAMSHFAWLNKLGAA